MTPLYSSVQDLTQIVGLGRSSIYEMLARGQFTAIKIGKRTLVDVAAAQRFMASQPAAVFTYMGADAVKAQ
jgi:hypothetical protein